MCCRNCDKDVFILFLSAPIPILGGAKAKFCIGYFCGNRGRISGPALMGQTDISVRRSFAISVNVLSYSPQLFLCLGAVAHLLQDGEGRKSSYESEGEARLGARWPL